MASEVLKLIFRGQDDTSKAVRSLRTNLDKAQKGIDTVKRSLGGVTTAIGAVAGAGGLGLLAKRALETGDALAKTSRKLGVAADELFTFQNQAELAGISTDTANMALQRFIRRTAEAAQGSGEAKNALKELRLDADKLQKLPLSERMEVLADAFQDVKNPADRLRIAFKLFDSEGAALVNMLADGSEGLREAEHRLDSLGITIKGATLPEIEKFNDSVSLVGKVIESAMIKGVAKAAPEMEKFADKAAQMAEPLVGKLFEGLDWILNNIGAIEKGVKAFVLVMVASKAVAFAAGVAQIATAMIALAPAVAAVLGPIGLVTTAIGAATAVYLTFKDEIDALLVKIRDEFLGAIDKLGGAFKSITSIFGDSDDQLKKNNKTTGEAIDETDGFTASIDDLQDIVVTATRRPLPDFAKEVDNIAGEEQRAATETDEFREAIEKLQQAARTGADDIRDFDKDLADFEKTVANTTATQEELDNAILNSIEGLTGVTFEQRELREEIAKVQRVLEVATDRWGENSEAVVVLRSRLKELNTEYLESLEQLGSLTKEQQVFIDKLADTDEKAAELKARILVLSDAYNKGLISGDEYADSVGRINQQLQDLKEEGLKGTKETIEGVFSKESVEDFIKVIGKGGDVDKALGDLAGSMIGSGGTQEAITDCFGVKPVQDFGQGIRDLFTGSGSALGAFQSALGSLSSALGDFFRDGEFKFSAFKDAILDALADIAAGAVASVGINFLKNLIPGLNSGGMIEGYATGGRVTGMGGPKEDKVLARLSPGEYVINAATVSKFGANFFDQINSGKMPGFALGGLAGGSAPAALPELGSLAGVPGLGQVAAIIATIINVFRNFVPGVGQSEGELKNEIIGKIAGFTRGSVGAAFDGIKAVFGAEPYQQILNRDEIINSDATPVSVQDVIADEIWGKIIGDRSFDRVAKIADALPGIDDGLANALYNYVGQNLAQIAFPQFNMDDVVARLFNSAQGVAGGSLTLAAREMGGPLERGQPALVGEGGPELFVPGRGGTVSPITRDGAQELVTAVHEVRDEISDLRRQFSRALSGGQLAGGRG